MIKTSLDTENFLREKRYLDNVSETTIKYYGHVFNRWEDYVGAEPTEDRAKVLEVGQIMRLTVPLVTSSGRRKLINSAFGVTGWNV